MRNPLFDQEHSLFTVHTAVALAVQESSDALKGDTISFRVPEQIRKDLKKILETRGTNVGAFLRACCIGLVNDYRD